LPYDRRTLSATYDFVGMDLDEPARALAKTGTAWVLVPLAIGATFAFGVRRRWDAVVLVLGAAFLSWVANPILKQLFTRDRPSVRPISEAVSRYTFPSGHAVASMSAAAVIAICAWPTRGRWFAIGAALVYVALVGATQITLGVHFPSDVIAGWLLALAAVALLAAALRRWGRLSR
jgi:membrane-associated phospholipid phosphatase